MFKRFLYSCIIGALISTLAIGAEVRKLTSEDIQWTDSTYPSVDCVVTSPGGHVGHPIDNTYRQSAPYVDVRSYLPAGFVTDGSVDYGTQLLAAVAAAEAAKVPLRLFGGTIWTSDPLVFTNTPAIYGNGGSIKYTGSGTAVTLKGWVQLYDVHVQTTHTAANGIMLGAGAGRITLKGVTITGETSTSNTGTGIYIYPDTAYIPSTHLENVRITYYKYGIHVNSTAPTTGTMNLFTGINVLLTGGNSIISGSRGVWFNEWTNGVGSLLLGGAIEYYDVGILVDNAAVGGSSFGLSAYAVDFEGNNTNWDLGANYVGEIVLGNPNGGYVRLGVPLAAGQRSYLDQLIPGSDKYIETYYSQKHLIHHGEPIQEFSVYMGDSFTNPAGTQVFIWGAKSIGTLASPHQTYMQFGTHKTSYSTAAPAAGDWTVGDIVYNSAADNVLGWKCTVAGTPGTWKAMTITLAP